MSQQPDQPLSAHAQTDDDVSLPCAEALVASTLALMTGHAQACCAERRTEMARQTASNLLSLAQNPLMSAGFRAMAHNLHARWATPALAGDVPSPVSPSEQSRALWHTTPEVIQ